MNQNASPKLQPPELDPVQEKTAVATSSAPVAGIVKARTAVHRAPPPPALIRRTVGLIVRPESWAEAARYPLKVTIASLMLVSLLVGGVLGVANGIAAVNWATNFASTYDQQHPAVLYEAGKLSIDRATAAGKALPFFSSEQFGAAVDLTGTKTLADFPQEEVLLITNDTLQLRMGGLIVDKTLADRVSLFAPGHENESHRIDGKFLTEVVAAKAPTIGLMFAAAVFVKTVTLCLAGAFFFAFAVIPIVAMGAPRLMMPRAVAYRISLASMIPLVSLGGLLEVLNISPTSVIPVQVMPFCWFFAAAGMALWAGILANQMFAAQRKRRAM